MNADLHSLHPLPERRNDARIYLRPPAPDDAATLIALNRQSIEHYQPWVNPPLDEAQFAGYLERSARADTAALLICRNPDNALLGVINLSQIFYGPLQSAYMGYYIGLPYAGQGYASAGIAAALDYAFGPLKLHRVEANIQPENRASIKLVARLGFTREGFSRRYLFIGGEWRDHERYAMLSEDWAEISRATT
ncbi:MAG: GNAT family N-acetyltransferase [Oscillochloris sp.]|nr:GNAT family N-acetyltransferase [Oscillochloris sp.]